MFYLEGRGDLGVQIWRPLAGNSTKEERESAGISQKERDHYTECPCPSSR